MNATLAPHTLFNLGSFLFIFIYRRLCVIGTRTHAPLQPSCAGFLGANKRDKNDQKNSSLCQVRTLLINVFFFFFSSRELFYRRIFGKSAPLATISRIHTPANFLWITTQQLEGISPSDCLFFPFFSPCKETTVTHLMNNYLRSDIHRHVSHFLQTFSPSITQLPLLLPSPRHLSLPPVPHASYLSAVSLASLFSPSPRLLFSQIQVNYCKVNPEEKRGEERRGEAMCLLPSLLHHNLGAC